MATVNSLRVLLRPTIPMAPRIQPIFVAAAPFSTTRAVAASAAPSAKSRRDLPRKVKKNYKKKATVTPVKKPNPGERKAFRKRIQLSNNSALPVEGLDKLQSTTMSQKENIGKVFGLSDATVDQLRALEAFKTTQAWNLFRAPHVLVREETAKLIQQLEDSKASKKAAKVVLTGSRLSGKSLAMLQAMSHALLNEWVVISIPEGQDLTNGNTEYSPVPDSQPMQYSQPVYIIKLLQNILKANKKVLSSLPVQDKASFVGNLKEGATLADLIANAKEGDAAWPSLQALWKELTLPGRPPVLFCLDGVSHINMMSDYRSPEFEPVHAHDLVVVRMFVDALSGKTALPNGGAVIAAMSGNNNHRHPSQELVLAQLEAGQAGKKDEIPTPDPYERKYDERVYESLKNVHVMRIEGMSVPETTTLMEYWGASGLLRSTITSNLVKEKWSLAGHGNVGELERATLKTMHM